tara:strand:- start:385 stop:852 length:468 start_codon:yes stop_codon:yes gene_type:complete
MSSRVEILDSSNEEQINFIYDNTVNYLKDLKKGNDILQNRAILLIILCLVLLVWLHGQLINFYNSILIYTAILLLVKTFIKPKALPSVWAHPDDLLQVERLKGRNIQEIKLAEINSLKDAIKTCEQDQKNKSKILDTSLWLILGSLISFLFIYFF